MTAKVSHSETCMSQHSVTSIHVELYLLISVLNELKVSDDFFVTVHVLNHANETLC